MSPYTVLVFAALTCCLALVSQVTALSVDQAQLHSPNSLASSQVLCFSTVIRVCNLELTRGDCSGGNTSARHTPQAVKDFRQAIINGWGDDAKISWAFTWLALTSTAENYVEIRKIVRSYVSTYDDEMTFIPSTYFAPMYNNASATNSDISDALKIITSVVGNGYRPKAIVAGYLSSETLQYLGSQENIHVAQGTIFSQFAIDYGDGDGGSPYPFYPTKNHYLQIASDNDFKNSNFVDVVTLDGWTVDFMNARRPGFSEGYNSRMGIGPIETIGRWGLDVGLQQMMHTTNVHFSTGFELNGFAYLTSIWELDLGVDVGNLTTWLINTRTRWPNSIMTTHGEFGLAWRQANPKNEWNYEFVEIGSGIGGSDSDKEIHWFINPKFRLALLRNLTDLTVGEVIDFTRYDLENTIEPSGSLTRSWNLMNVLNMKQSRGVQDQPRRLSELSSVDQQLIYDVYPNLKPVTIKSLK